MTKTSLKRFLEEYPKALSDGAGAIFVGAGVSMAAGYPSWSELLREIGEELGVGGNDVHDLAALAQWSILESGGATRVRSVIKREIGVEKPIPQALDIVCRLPVRHIWTTNYDSLVERSFRAIQRPIDVVSSAQDLALRCPPGATRLYKMHGSVDRPNDVVISTDDYELYRSRRGAYLPLLQSHLTSMSMLFIGLSFTDPNVRHVLSLIRESFTDAPPEHFAIVRPPRRDQCPSEDVFKARTAQHNLWAKDLRRYGLLAVEIDDYDEVPQLLRRVERGVAARRVWVSGSWPVEHPAQGMERAYRVAESIGQRIGAAGLDLVTGAGLTVGPATLAGFLSALREGGGWDLDRRLIARPFPQPLEGNKGSEDWPALRREMARQAGIVIIVGGLKVENGKVADADGVFEEFALAKEAGAFVIPVGSTGGAALSIAQGMLGTSDSSTGSMALRPTDEELGALCDVSKSATEAADLVLKVLARARKLI